MNKERTNAQPPSPPLRIAVIGTGISGMSAAWLLSERHDVTVYEKAGWVGGHSHTVEAPGGVPVDTGFIVYNNATYPNLTALFEHLEVPTHPTEMSFAVSAGSGRMEYGGNSLSTLFAQKRNLLRPRFWRMLRDLLRFYRQAPRDCAVLDQSLLSLGDYLDQNNFSPAFQEDHLLPMAAAIWSCPSGTARDYPAVAFTRFCENHGLLNLGERPQWRTVSGGSREYVSRLTARYAARISLNRGAQRVQREAGRVLVQDSDGATRVFDHVVLACHADEALALLAAPSAREQALLGAFRYTSNLAVLHDDARLMPKRRAVWSSWNYLARNGTEHSPPCVTYWMNRLQNLPIERDIFLTLNPAQSLSRESIIARNVYEHPIFDAAAIAAQRELWSLQGEQRSWFCGAYFGAGFHEDGLQAGLAVAEALGGTRRPWQVKNESGRICLGPSPAPARQWADAV
ncbi:NAD/FAD-binding protein [Acidocella aquatica]|uniref:NAD/FAD-binding protein n=1 Tax=Acidocella aquatica TaxID=1922313 RepID=A0ABQ6A3F2_9PROT|nr:FAD-dependent oxidoreductase [Acidocella aquatica]GLR67015.1 NAD/FAD-binding protein [Acidocella aquatica]